MPPDRRSDPSAARPSRWRAFATALSSVSPFAAGPRRDDDALGRALESARHYRHLYYSAPVALVSCDPHGTVLRWNDRADAWFAGQLQKGRVNALAELLGARRR